MAEGALEDVLGGEGVEEIEGEALPGVAADAVAMAAALDGARHDARLATKLGGYVDRQAALADHQTQLIKLQTEHLHEQRELTLSHMHWRRFSDRMKAVLQIMTAAVGLGVAVGVAWMAWSASQERGLVIEPFSIPPDMAAKGLNGQVVASMLLDRLGEMQHDTPSARARSTFANNWNDEIKVEIPETGVSIGELRRLLVHWLGRQTTISGEVYRTATGIAVAARTGAAVAVPHEGAEADVDKLIQQAAQDVFAASQPYRYAIYLENSVGNLPAAQVALEKLARTGDRTDRIWAYSALTNIRVKAGDFAGGIRAASQSIAIDPEFPLAYANRGAAEAVIGHNQSAAADASQAADLIRRFGRRYMQPDALAYIIPNWEGPRAVAQGDFAKAVAEDQALLANPGQEDGFDTLALDQIAMHEPTVGRATVSQLPDTLGQVASHTQRVQYVYEQAALELEDWAGAWAAYAAVDHSKQRPGAETAIRTALLPDAAVAKAHLGDLSGARALASSTPLDCYTCAIDRGRIEAVAGDAAAADRWFAQAVRQGPALPFAYVVWAKVLLDRGDLAGAAAKAGFANQHWPKFADPLAVWAEALMRQGDLPGAIKRFAQANEDAPRWGRNHLRWGEALLRSGQYRSARAHFEAAGGLDLSRPDRAALDVFLARTAAGPLRG